MKFKYKLEMLSIKFFSSLLKFLPEKFKYSFAAFLGKIGYYSIKKRRHMAIKNIQLAFPEKSLKEAKKIALNSYINMSKVFLSSFWLPETINKPGKITFKNMEILDNAYSEGKGVILATMHMGNFEAASYLAHKYPFYAIAKRQKNPLVNSYITQQRESLGIHIILRDKGITRNLIEALNNKGIIALLSDHYGNGVEVSFFGRKTKAPTGAVNLALKRDIPILFGHCILDNNNNNIVVVKQKIELIKTGNLKHDIQINTQNLIHIMENAIQEYPEQWMWFHNRWKGEI